LVANIDCVIGDQQTKNLLFIERLRFPAIMT